MTREECRQLVDAYVEWLRRGISAEAVGEACELTTPFLDRHNDHIQIYAVRRNGKIVLSDDGYILSDLRTSGLELTTPKRRNVLETALRGFGIQLEEGRLVVEASPRNLGQRVHSLIQAMLALNDMFVMAQPRVASFFWEDVRDFLDAHRVRYSPRVKLAGKTGYDHAIDFLIPRSPEAPERLLQAINSPNRSSIASYLFVLTDTREGRGLEAEAYAFLNDQDREVGGDVIEALEVYQVHAALWSQREEFAPRLAA
jgi:Domain of unknown function DUF1828/Domain of unknown function DUF1829